ncbi:MAG: hypothetical protein JW783_12425 [Bacteroidales bacterium]|nr:hypothetical protein [Bacteroidales bacterium]MBN2748585.1 hypothetical protein [Bacteroidales bacterium]
METNAEKLNRQVIIIQGIRNSSDESLILMLEEFRESGESFIVPAIIEQLFTDRTEKFTLEAVAFLADLKEQSCVPMLADGIRAYQNNKDISNLVSVCWQCRLNFIDELPLFFDLVINADYQTAFEAFTVIENAAEALSEDALMQWIDYTKAAIDNASAEKVNLLNETLNVLNDFMGRA